MAGFPTSRIEKSVFDVPEQEREEVFESLWQRGGFNFGLGNFNNILLDPKANKVSKDFASQYD